MKIRSIPHMLLFLSLSFVVVLIFPAYANLAIEPTIVEDKKTVVTTEHISEEKRGSQQVDVYKTKKYEQTQATVQESVQIVESDNITTQESRTYSSSSYEEWDTIIVTARRVPTNKSNVAENVIVVTKEDIAAMPARDLTDVLTYVPSVDVQLNGGFGRSTALSMNGSSARQVLLMVDGIPFNTQLSGQANPSQIPLGNIERIEIIKGASSSAWGSSLGGVINVITKDVGDSTTPMGSITNSFGEFSTSKHDFELSGRIKEIGYFVSGSHFTTDGPQYRTNADEEKFFGKLSLPVSDKATLTGSFGINDANTNYSLFTDSSISSQPYLTRYGKLLFELDEEDYHLNVAYKYNDQNITSNFIRRSDNFTTFSTISSNVYHGLSINGSRDLHEYGELVAGVDLDWHLLKSSLYLDESQDINTQAPYINHLYQWNNFDFITGLRYDNNEQFGSQTSPSFGTVYHFNNSNNTLIRAKVARDFNAPPLLWITNYHSGFRVGPNPDLKAERSKIYELGLETTVFETLDLNLNLYRADVKEAIALTTEVSTNLRIQENFERFRRQGVELLADYKVNDAISVYGSGAFNDVENRITRQTVRDQGVARQRYTFGAKYKNVHHFGVHLLGYYNRWSSSAGNANDRRPIFDVKFTKEFMNIRENMDMELFFNIHNIRNSTYWSSPSFPLPKRYLEGGVSLKF